MVCGGFSRIIGKVPELTDNQREVQGVLASDMMDR